MANILITGAAGGIGQELVQRALARSDTVVAVVRKAADASSFRPSPRLHVVAMDVSDTASVERGFEEADQKLGEARLDAVVNAAALSIPGAIELTSVREFEQIFNTNTLGSLRVLKAALPRLRGHGGRLVLVTSLWGRASGPLLGAYCASKHAIESLADTARRETAGMKVHIIVAEPGVVKTDMYTNQVAETEGLIGEMSPAQNALYGALYRRYRKLVASSGGQAITAAQCAAGIEKALFARRPRVRYRIGMDSRFVCFLAWLLPDRWMDAVMGGSLNNRPLPADYEKR